MKYGRTYSSWAQFISQILSTPLDNSFTIMKLLPCIDSRNFESCWKNQTKWQLSIYSFSFFIAGDTVNGKLFIKHSAWINFFRATSNQLLSKFLIQFSCLTFLYDDFLISTLDPSGLQKKTLKIYIFFWSC